MVNDESKCKLGELTLDGLRDALSVQDENPALFTDMSFDEHLELAIDELYQTKNNKCCKRLIQGTHFRVPEADINVMYYAGRNLDKDQLVELSTCQYPRNNNSIAIEGFNGLDKTYNLMNDVSGS